MVITNYVWNMPYFVHIRIVLSNRLSQEFECLMMINNYILRENSENALSGLINVIFPLNLYFHFSAVFSIEFHLHVCILRHKSLNMLTIFIYFLAWTDQIITYHFLIDYRQCIKQVKRESLFYSPRHPAFIISMKEWGLSRLFINIQVFLQEHSSPLCLNPLPFKGIS